MKYRVITAAILLLMTGITTLGYGALSDPFSIPFQDPEQIPTEQQALYQSQSDVANRIRRFGTAALTLGMITLAAGLWVKPSKSPLSSASPSHRHQRDQD